MCPHRIRRRECDSFSQEIGDLSDWPILAHDHDAAMRLVVPDECQIGARLDSLTIKYGFT